MRKITDVLITLTLLLSLNAHARKIRAFESLATKTVRLKTVAVPHTEVVSHVGYAARGVIDREAGGKTSEASDPLNSQVQDLYRFGFTTYKTGCHEN